MDRAFIAKVKSCLCLLQWGYRDLAMAAGYQYSSIRQFMCGAIYSNSMHHKIASALDIKINEENTSEGSDCQCCKND